MPSVLRLWHLTRTAPAKDEYIANLVFDKSSARLHLYVTNKDRRVSKVVQIGDGNDSEYIKKLKFYQTRAMLCLTAGDF